MSGGTYDVISLEGLQTEQVIMLASLQGLVNRSAARVYFLTQSEGPEKHWMEWYSDYGLTANEISVDEFMVKYVQEAKGYIVYDPRLPDTLNIALSMAGVNDCVVCSPSWEKRLAGFGLTCSENLVGRWSGWKAAYDWAISELMPRTNRMTLANYDYGLGMEAKPTFDFLVARQGFCMGVSVNEADFPEECDLWHQVLLDAPEGAMMIGWHTARDTEATHVTFCSRYDILVYCAGAWNMSFHQHIPHQYEYSQDHCERAECEPEGRYATMVLSDGDSWHSMADLQKRFWMHPQRGEVALGWEVAPVFARLAPALLEYYYETRTENDYLICGPSGIGYNYLSIFGSWEDFVEKTSDVMSEVSLQAIWVLNREVRHLPGGIVEHKLRGRTIHYTKAQMEEFGGAKDANGADLVDPETVERYVRGVPMAMGFFQGWERIPGELPRWLDGKLWCPTAAVVRKDVDATIAEFEQAAQEQQPGPVFVSGHVNCYDATMESIIEVGKGLESKGFKVVRPDMFLQLAQDAFRKEYRK